MYREFGCFGFVEVTFDGKDVLWLGLMKAGSCVFKAIFVSKTVPFFGVEGFSIVGEHFLGVPLRAYSSITQLITALVVVDFM